jgi:menaquinone-dependent protoporphyrinogen IX oxidase
MNKTLIVYGTRKGTTRETAIVISEVLKNNFSHQVDICDSKQIREYRKRIDEYNNVIIGSSIVSGFWKSRVLSFAKKDIFQIKNVAVFVTAGGTLNKVEKYGISKEDAIKEGIEKYIDKYSKKFGFIPISKTAFGGKVVRKEVVRYNSWNKQDIINWTMELGNQMHFPI